MEDEKADSEEPKTQTESSGGGIPPGKTRVGGGAEGNDFFDHNPPPKHSLGYLQTEANDVINAIERELNNQEKADPKEVALLQELFLIIFEEIHAHADREALRVSAELLQRVQKLTTNKTVPGNESE